MATSVLFVDDEEDIRFSFEDYFEGHFPLKLCADGKEALTTLENHPEIGVVVTDIRMPEMDGLELIQSARDVNPNLGFIVVSGHGDTEDIIRALRLGARNYLKKPYDFVELHHAIQQEVRRFEILREELRLESQQKLVEELVTSVGEMTYELDSNLSLINPMAYRVANLLEAVGLVEQAGRGNVTLAMIEILNNAIEHGNFGITSDEKVKLKSVSEQEYVSELERRQADPALRDRKVRVTITANSEGAKILIEDEGKGFDYKNLPDPTDPENLFLPSGRGILLARAFLDDVRYEGKGNKVILEKWKDHGGREN